MTLFGGRKIDFWQSIAIISLLVAVFSFYIKDTQRISIFYVLFFGIVAYILYDFYQKNKNFKFIIDKDGMKILNHKVLILLIEVLFVLYLVFIIQFIMSLIFMPGVDFPKIIWMLAVSTYLGFTLNKFKFERKKPYLVKIDTLLCLIAVTFTVLIIFVIPDNNNIVLLYAKYYILLGSITAFTGAMMLLSIICKISYNLIEAKNKFERKWIKFSVVDFFKQYVFLMFFGFMIIMVFWQPTVDVTISEYTSNCTQEFKYTLNDNQKGLFGVYKKSLDTNLFNTTDLIFEGILEKDGDYVSINITDPQLNRKYKQYFDFNVRFDEKLGRTIYEFHNKNIVLLDKLYIIAKSDTCISSNW